MLQPRNFPHFAHHFDARQNAKQMQMIRRKNRRKTSGKSVKIFTNPTSYRGIRKCPKTLPREEKVLPREGKTPTTRHSKNLVFANFDIFVWGEW